MYKDEYDVLGRYKNNNTDIKLKHNKCNNIFYMKPRSFYMVIIFVQNVRIY